MEPAAGEIETALNRGTLGGLGESAEDVVRGERHVGGERARPCLGRQRRWRRGLAALRHPVGQRRSGKQRDRQKVEGRQTADLAIVQVIVASLRVRLSHLVRVTIRFAQPMLVLGRRVGRALCRGHHDPLSDELTRQGAAKRSALRNPSRHFRRATPNRTCQDGNGPLAGPAIVGKLSSEESERVLDRAYEAVVGQPSSHVGKTLAVRTPVAEIERPPLQEAERQADVPVGVGGIAGPKPSPGKLVSSEKNERPTTALNVGLKMLTFGRACVKLASRVVTAPRCRYSLARRTRCRRACHPSRCRHSHRPLAQRSSRRRRNCPDRCSR